MKKFNTPQRILPHAIWYFCLFALLSAVTPVTAHPFSGHAHNRHERSRHREGVAYRNLYLQSLLTMPGDQNITEVPTITAVRPTVPASTVETAAPKAAPVIGDAAVNVVPPVKAVKKTAPIPSVPTVTAPLDMTRDAQVLPLESQPLHDTASMNISGQIVRMLGALLVVLLLILGAVNLLRKYNLVPQHNHQTSALERQVSSTSPASAGALMSALQRNPAKRADTRATSPSPADAGGFQLLSSLTLPGNSASVHLVQASHRLLVLGASQSAGVTLLTEIGAANAVQPQDRMSIAGDAVEQEDDDDDEALSAFADILREKAGLPARFHRPDLTILDQVSERVSATQERLNSRLNAGAQLTSSMNNGVQSEARRRVARTSVTRGSEQ